MAGAERSDRVAACAVDFVDSRPIGDGPVLYFADLDDDFDVSDDEDDAADDGGSGVYAAVYGIYLLPVFERAEFVYVHEQPGGNRTAVLFEQDRTVAVAGQIQEE